MSLFGQKQKTVEPDVIPTTVEQAIPIRDVCEDGIFLVGRNLWSKTYRFTMSITQRHPRRIRRGCSLPTPKF